jgi:hypothetical protein
VERLIERLQTLGCIRGRHTLALLLEPIVSRAGDARLGIRGLVKDLDALCARPAGGEPCPYLGLNAFTEQNASGSSAASFSCRPSRRQRLQARWWR